MSEFIEQPKKRGRGRPRKFPTPEAAQAAATIARVKEDPPRVIEGLLATVKQAAHALQVSDKTVWNLIDSGHLRSIKIGGTRRIHWDALKALALTGTQDK